MQRTVKGVTVKLAKVEILNGAPTITDEIVKKYVNTDEKTAMKKAQKSYIGYAIIATEEFNDLYILDDEIFFKYATKVENDK